MTNSDILDRVLAHEGGFVDNPNDRGGPTNFGITYKTYIESLDGDFLTSEFATPAKLLAQLKALTKEQARAIYQKMYIEDPHFDRITNSKVRWLLVDIGVNNGRARAIRWLQEALGVAVDGKLGVITTMNGNLVNQTDLFNKLLKRRFRAYAELVRAKHSQAVFIVGWIERACHFIGEAP